MMFLPPMMDVFLSPSQSSKALWLFTVYGVGYLARPVGGVLFSHFGDRIGRKRLFRLSIIMMSISTLAIGLLPGFEIPGYSALPLLGGLRLIQGFSVGGELPGALVFAAEHISPGIRGRVTSAIVASAVMGMVMASTAGVLVNALLEPEQITAWG